MRWRARLFDGPSLEDPSGNQVRHFRSRRVGALFAYLALHLGQQCPRETLADAIWPEESDLSVVANRLRVALASLRSQLEPPGVPFGNVLDVSMPGCVSLRSDAVTCDVAELEDALKKGAGSDALELVKGELLPGYVEDWVVLERYRLEALVEALRDELALATPAVIAGGTQPPVPRDVVRAHLPLYLTHFFGRDEEKRSLLDLLRRERLVTIAGPGGTGKTRLSVETGRALGTACLFVGLAEYSSGTTVAEPILNELRISASAERDPFDQAAEVLFKREIRWMILDNAEHLVESVAEAVLRLLQDLPDLSILVTSRQRLDLPGEVVIQLGPLETPVHVSDIERLLESPSAALFVDRARNARPDFKLLSRHCESVVEICQALEGMPLAIELAAARVVAQTPLQIRDSLQAGLLDLRSRQRGLLARHQSLRASIQGSFDALSPVAHAFLCRLSVFRGGWTSKAAESITETPEVEALLEELSKRSLIRSVEVAGVGQLRYSQLISIREFARSLLTDDAWNRLRKRHSDYYLSLAGAVSEDDILTLRSLDSEQENILTALDFALAERDLDWAVPLTGALIHAHVRGHHRAFLPYAERALELAGSLGTCGLRTRLRVSAYYLFSYLGRLNVVQQIGETILTDSAASSSQHAKATANWILAFVDLQIDLPESALARSQEALRIARRLEDQTLIWRALRIAAYESLSVALHPAMAKWDLQGLFRQSEELSRECLATLPPESTHSTFEKLTLCYALREQRRIPEAFDALCDATSTAVDHDMEAMLLFCLREGCRYYSTEVKDFETAGILFGGFLQVLENTGYDDRAREQNCETLIQELGTDRASELAREGKTMSSEQLLHILRSPQL